MQIAVKSVMHIAICSNENYKPNANHIKKVLAIHKQKGAVDAKHVMRNTFHRFYFLPLRI